MIYVGIDLGSRFIKAAVEINGKIEYIKENTIDFYKKRILRDKNGTSVDLSFLGLQGKPVQILSTGYGRNLLQFENTTVISEIKAHFYGAKSQHTKGDFTLVDIGGQDCKVIDIKDGYISDFTMNDKCAASTGRFIEQAADILGIPLEEFITATDNPVHLSDTCAVFCESELIGQLARGVPERHLAAGVNLSVARRLAPAIRRYKPEYIRLAGGGSSPALKHFLTDLTGAPCAFLPERQFNGALGCIAYLKRFDG